MCVRQCVPLLCPIPPGQLFFYTQAVSLAVLCLSEIWTWMRWATAHSTHSSVVHPLLLDVEQIDLGVDYSGGTFHNFWLASLHLLLRLCSVHLPPSKLTPIPSCGSAGYRWRRPVGRVVISQIEVDADWNKFVYWCFDSHCFALQCVPAKKPYSNILCSCGHNYVDFS